MLHVVPEWHVTEVVSGTARGVDRCGETWARSRGISVARMFAEWGTHGHAAGLLRNEDMARYADALVALWDGHSTGTRHMICTMLALGKPVRAFVYTPARQLLKII